MIVSLDKQVALVTGASRGVGKGVANGLADAGMKVYATGRSIAGTVFPNGVVAIPCDHSQDTAVAEVFQLIESEAGRLDILVNAAWGGYERMVEDGRFTWPAPFWEQPRWRWDAMMTAGVRRFCGEPACGCDDGSRGRGLIVNISHWAAQKHIGNAIYGVSKAATDKLTADMAHELKPYGVSVVSLYPGLVRTEAVLAAGVFDLSNSESPEFIGRAVAALAADADGMRRTGSQLVAADLALEYGFADVDGRQPKPLSLADV